MKIDFGQPTDTFEGVLEGPLPQKQTAYSNGYDLRASLVDVTGKPRMVETRSASNRVAILQARTTPLFPDRFSITLPYGFRALVPTGIRTVLPETVDAQIRPRSGLAWKHGVTILNAPGTVDPDFKGEWHLILQNHSDEPFEIVDGDRLAQVVFTPVLAIHQVRHDPVIGEWADQSPFIVTTTRGEGGYGSTGA